MPECDCTGPNALTATGECRVLAEFAIVREVQRRRADGEPPMTADELDRMHAERGLELPQEARRRAIEARERDSDGQGMEWRLQRLGVPPRAILDLRRLQDTAAMDAARKANAIPGEMCPFLALLGEPGQGKTVAAAWMFREAARRTCPDLPTGAPEPLVWVQAATFTRLSAFSSDDEQLLKRLRAARLVVLDDLGDEATALGVATAVELCKGREAAGRRTLITSNLTPPAFRARYGDALWDRLHARGIVEGLRGASMRKRGGTTP